MIQFNEKPPTLFSIMQSLVNYDKEEVKIKDLPKFAREKIFDFEYPLSNKINKEDFENSILKKFIMRRIEFETFTAFKIQLDVKLNEIMPNYNKMFDFIDEWNLFNDGEMIEKLNTGTQTLNNTGTETLNNTGTDTVNNTGKDTLKNTGTDTVNNTGTDTLDKRNSQLPQDEISNVQNSSYLTNYDLNTNTLNTQNQRTLNTQNEHTLNTQNQRTLNTQSKNTLNTQNQRTDNLRELILKSPSDKMRLYSDFSEKKQNIYSMIFKDLECLFYGLL